MHNFEKREKDDGSPVGCVSKRNFLLFAVVLAFFDNPGPNFRNI